MCGIFGCLIKEERSVFSHDYINTIEQLMKLSESRGKEASGFAIMNKDSINVVKRALKASKLIKTVDYKKAIHNIKINNGKIDEKISFIGHARMVTNGDASIESNNQPVIKHGMVCIHNGIIVNDEELWKESESFSREYEVDTEILLEIINDNMRSNNMSYFEAIKKSLKTVKGAVTIALINKNSDDLILYTNVGSLYYATNKSIHMFASEKYILEKVMDSEDSNKGIIQIKPKHGIIFSIKNNSFEKFSIESKESIELDYSKDKNLKSHSINSKEVPKVNISRYHELEKLMNIEQNKIEGLKRCKKCLLPETFPFIKYNNSGVCNYCESYKPLVFDKEENLVKMINKNRIENKNTQYDCIMPLSGGRDSCYGLHYLVKELKLKPVAYTYDWGMVTDIARRNISRMCSELGVEHVLISADIKRKRKNIGKNVSAWLKKPDIGTVPLFMAGDKQFFYYAALLRKQMNVGTILFSMNRLERTDFKVGFCGINEVDKNNAHYNLELKNKLKLIAYYSKQFLINPQYINSTLLDTMGGFASYYIIPHEYSQIFNYVKWNEETVESTLLNNYDWEIAKDTTETWRIGDGTAAFYNYIYYKVAGFSEHDTFRSNQIRENELVRETAYKKIHLGNRPRVDSFEWYCNTIGIDPILAIKTINSMKTLY